MLIGHLKTLPYQCPRWQALKPPALDRRCAVSPAVPASKRGIFPAIMPLGENMTVVGIQTVDGHAPGQGRPYLTDPSAVQQHTGPFTGTGEMAGRMIADQSRQMGGGTRCGHSDEIQEAAFGMVDDRFGQILELSMMNK